MGDFSALLATLNGYLWHEYVLYAIVGTGILFTVWSGFCQFRALTHGPAVVRGVYDDPDDPGAINHFQALSAALSGTVGLGNIGGVALAIALGGPGAIFWMWIVGFLGMSIKFVEVTLSMLYRNTDDPENPHGGPMFVVREGFRKLGLGALGSVIGGIFESERAQMERALAERGLTGFCEIGVVPDFERGAIASVQSLHPTELGDGFRVRHQAAGRGDRLITQIIDVALEDKSEAVPCLGDQPVFPHVRCGRKRCFAVEIDAGVYAAAGHVDLAVAEPRYARHLRIDYALNQGCGHGRVDGVAARHEHPGASF